MGNIIWRFMKASPDTVGWAVGVFVWAVTLQLAVVTTVGLFHYDSIAEDSQVYDYVWFVYREMPSTLPVILVYSGAMTAIMLSVGIYIRIGFTIGELATRGTASPSSVRLGSSPTAPLPSSSRCGSAVRTVHSRSSGCAYSGGVPRAAVREHLGCVGEGYGEVSH